MSYVDPFGVSAVNPSDVSYKALNLTVNATLEWPSFTTTGETTARILDVTTTVGLTISLPTAMQGSTGEDILFKNVGSNTFTILDYDGNTITTVSSGAAKYIYLTDVSTTAGVWVSIAFGVGSTSVDAASLVGYGIKAISASLNQSHPATVSAVNFTIGTGDRAQLYLDTGGATISLPTASGIGNDFFFLVRNISVGTTIIDASGADLIDGASSITLAPEESCMVCCSGTAWYTVGRGRSTTFAYTQLTKNVAGSSDVTLSGTEAGYAILKFIGALTGNINVIVPNVTAVWYVDNSTTGVYTLTVKTAAGSGVAITAANRVILYCDGTNVQDAQTVFTTSGAFTAGSASVPSITFGTDPDTGLYSVSANILGITANGTQVATFSGAGLTLTTDLAVTEGGTGASSASSARSNLGISATNTPSTPSGNLAATDVQAALNELQSDVDTRAVASTVTSALALKVSKTSDTGSAVLPAGTTAQRDGSPVTGYTRFNSTTGKLETWNGSAWLSGSTPDDTAYGAGWNGNLDAPTKNAVYDKIETVAVGLQTIYIPAGAMTPRTTNGAQFDTFETATNKVMARSLLFDAATQEFAQFNVRMPKSWNESTVTTHFVWSHGATTTNFGVVWGLQGVAISDDDALDVAFGTAQVIADTGGTTNDLYQTSVTPAITIGGTPQELDWVAFQIYRDVAAGGDTMAVDARLHGVVLMYSTNASNDA
jgi:hypothetical protein